MMLLKKIVFSSISTLLFFCQLFAQGNNCDGPYVFYRGNTIIVKSIVNDSLRIDSFPAKDKSRHLLSVRFSDHPDWNFNFTLHPSIAAPAAIYHKANKIIAFSDIEGEFEPFRAMLLKNGVIDKKYKWVFGKGLLVIAGDLFDRGNEVTSYVWLLYKLEQEAKKKGGAVHVVLGNHEIMNLSGDTRYVQPKYFDAAQQMHTGYNSLFNENTELGKWLRSKNIVEKIGDILALHGGISPVVIARRLSIDSFNVGARPFYDKSQSQEIPPAVQDLFNENSPFWYRGYFLEPRATEEQVNETLSFYKCKKIIVGHDIVDSVTSLYGGKVIGIDVNEHEGFAQGLFIKGRNYYVIDKTGNRKKLL